MNVDHILKSAYLAAEEKQKLHDAYASRDRTIAVEKSWRMRNCPGCGQGLALKLTATATLFYCKGCSFAWQSPIMMNEARTFAEPFTPGVTGKPSPTVIMSADGRKIRRII